MKIYLKPDGANWKLYEGDYKELAQEWGKLGIDISASARIGAYASIGASARIGDDAKIASQYGLVLMGPLGSRQAMLTGYMHKDELRIGTGCFLGLASDFLERVKTTHGNNEHAKAYREAVAFMRAILCKAQEAKP